MATVIAMIPIELAIRHAVFVGIKLMTKLLLVRGIVTMRIAVHYDVRSRLHADKEHRENRNMANNRSHKGVSLLHFSDRSANQFHIEQL